VFVFFSFSYQFWCFCRRCRWCCCYYYEYNIFTPYYRVSCPWDRIKPIPHVHHINFMDNIFEIELSSTSLTSWICVLFTEGPSTAVLRWNNCQRYFLSTSSVIFIGFHSYLLLLQTPSCWHSTYAIIESSVFYCFTASLFSSVHFSSDGIETATIQDSPLVSRSAVSGLLYDVVPEYSDLIFLTSSYSF
jgi:hypothetical protein